MKIGLIAIAGVKIQTRKFVELGITLPQFVNRGEVIATVHQLEEGVMALWRDLWNADAYAGRKRSYRRLLRSARAGSTPPAP